MITSKLHIYGYETFEFGDIIVIRKDNSYGYVYNNKVELSKGDKVVINGCNTDIDTFNSEINTLEIREHSILNCLLIKVCGIFIDINIVNNVLEHYLKDVIPISSIECLNIGNVKYYLCHLELRKGLMGTTLIVNEFGYSKLMNTFKMCKDDFKISIIFSYMIITATFSNGLEISSNFKIKHINDALKITIEKDNKYGNIWESIEFLVNMQYKTINIRDYIK